MKKVTINKNAVYDSDAKALTISNHQKFAGKHLFACECGNEYCTGSTAGTSVYQDVQSIEDASSIAA